MTANLEDGRSGANAILTFPQPSERSSPFHGLVRELLGRRAPDAHAPVVGVTSAEHRSGVTTIVARLGVCAAEIVDRPVLLIDCNASAPDLVASFNLPFVSGVKEIVSGEQSLADCVFQTRIKNLMLLGPGARSFERGNTHEGRGWSGLLKDAASRFGIVIVDLPPTSELLASVTSLQGIDPLLMVVEAERTRRQAAARAQSQLQRIGIELGGVVLNKRRKHIPEWIYRRI